MKKTYLLFVAGLYAAMAPAEVLNIIFERGLAGFDGFQDTTIFSESNHSGGGTEGVFAGRNRLGNLRRALLRIELTGIPEGAVVTGAELRLTVDRLAQPVDIEYRLHRLLKPWGEGAVVGPGEGGFGGNPSAGDATWISNRHGESTWDTPGGDFAAEASAAATVGGALGAAGVWTGELLAADVRRWLQKPETNFGWLLKSALETTNQEVKRFVSSEGSGPRPRLTLTVETAPAPADIDADGAVVARDVQLAINGALDIDTFGYVTDVNRDGVTNSVDVQLTILAALQ